MLFFQNPSYLALVLIGANMPDFDHKFKKDNVYQMIILGLIILFISYVLNLPIYLGLVIILLGVIFYFSNHRGFTHSILGILSLAGLITFLLMAAFLFVLPLNSPLNNLSLLTIMIIFLGVLFLNKKLMVVFVVLFILSLIFLPNLAINYYLVFDGVFLGLLSHLILDSFSISGVSLLIPFSKEKFYKKFGIVMCFSLVIIALNQYFNFLNHFLQLLIYVFN